MEPPCEDTTRELSQSLISLANSDVLWARLIGKFRKRLDNFSPPELDDIQQI